jgi:hypothetical protein
MDFRKDISKNYIMKFTNLNNDEVSTTENEKKERDDELGMMISDCE